MTYGAAARALIATAPPNTTDASHSDINSDEWTLATLEGSSITTEGGGVAVPELSLIHISEPTRLV